MNTLEMLKLHEELVALRRRVMKLDEYGEGYHQLQKPKGYYDEMGALTGDKKVRKGHESKHYDPRKDPVSRKKPWEVKESASQDIVVCRSGKSSHGSSAGHMDEAGFGVGAGRGNPGHGLETQTMGNASSSRTGLDEYGFGAVGEPHGQDAQYSSDRKRGHEGDPKLEEGLESYWEIAGL